VASDGPCGVLELRRYTLLPGRRDELIELFDAHLVEPQEEVGIHVLGQFRDVERPDHFVWIRGFADLASRTQGLTRFYLEGDAWARHRSAANATMVDSDDVLLLRPAPGMAHPCRGVGPRDAPSGHRAPYAVLVHHLRDADEKGSQRWLADAQSAVHALAGKVVGVLRTESAPNGFPRLPVREDADVLVLIARFGSLDAAAATPGLGAERLVLVPTSRSSLR